MFLVSFKNDGDDPTRNSFDRSYMPLVEIEDLNALINNKSFFDQPLKNKQQVYEKLIKTPEHEDYITGKLLHFPYH